jgi:hypothetical protein
VFVFTTSEAEHEGQWHHRAGFYDVTGRLRTRGLDRKTPPPMGDCRCRALPDIDWTQR